MQIEIGNFWVGQILTQLMDYIQIEAVSPHFDPQWEARGNIHQVVLLAREWCNQFVPYLHATVEVHQIDGRTPVLLIDIPGEEGTDNKTTLLYGHLDKQPPMDGWDEGLGPWTPVLRTHEDGSMRLYGRGGADDGYAVFAAMCAVVNARQQGHKTGRCVILIETAEESGSPDLPIYLGALKDKIGSPGLIIALDSGCGTYDRLWLTTSLRGVVVGTLRVDVLTQAVHSGDAGGIVPDSFRIARALLDRIEDPDTGLITLNELRNQVVSEDEIAYYTSNAALALGEDALLHFPWISDELREDVRQQGGRFEHEGTGSDFIRARTWGPALAITAAEGLPPISGEGSGGNVLRPFTALKLVMRIPPTVNADYAYVAVKQVLERAAPQHAKVSFIGEGHPGWMAPTLAPWLEVSLNRASQEVFGKDMVSMGEGGTIPFMKMLGDTYPDAQFVITGVLGPGSNAHGPNEFLHVDYAIKLSTCIANILIDYVAADTATN